MPEAISTQNLVTLPITSQELGRGAFLPPPNQNRTTTTIGLKKGIFWNYKTENSTVTACMFSTSHFRRENFSVRLNFHAENGLKYIYYPNLF